MQNPSASTATSPRARVLVVDDDPLTRRSIVRLLKLRGFEVCDADGGVAALAALRDAPYDVVLSDIGMPGLGGVGLLKAVRAEHKHLPMVLLTGAPSTETAIEALRYGAFSYLTKPCDSDALVDELTRAARHHELACSLDVSPALARELHADHDLEASFDRALEGLYMAYQPIMDIAAGRPYGFEALVRTSEKSIPHPGALLDAAEHLNRLPDLGRKIRLACARAFSASEEGPLLFVNLHTRDLLDDDLFARSAPLSALASRVVLEITERAQLEEVPDFRERADALRRLGFRIAIDDIGAGYAGLTSFATVEPEFIKLDMSLVRDVHVTPVKRRLVQSMMSLSQDLAIHVIAEGIETVEEADVITQLGCGFHQGYYYGKPAREVPWALRSIGAGEVAG